MRELFYDRCVHTGNTELLGQWDERNAPLTPKTVSYGSKKKLWWHCRKGHSWQAAVYNRSAGAGCPYCAGKAVMHDRKSLYSRNKRNSRAILCPDAFEQDHPLTPEQFSSEEEFRFWKMWSDENYHGWELADHMLLTRPLYRKLLFPILRRRRSPTRRTESHRHSSILFEAKVDRPKAAPFVGSFYDSAEVQKLFEAAKGSKLEIPIFLGAFYGLRRSEAIGLKWDAIDFRNDTITIRHTVVSCYIDGKRVQKAQDITKTKSSMRTLPLIPAFKELLQHKKQQQNEFQRMCGKSYNKDYLGYICVDEMGRLLSPHYLTEAFAKLLKTHGLRKIRYHDLRHSCASLLLANGVPMKQIQEWLGHSDFSTTANVYAHLECNSKRLSAAAMTNGLQDALNAIS